MDGVEIELDVVGCDQVLQVAEGLRAQTAHAYARPVDEYIGLLDAAGALWSSETYPARQEAMEILPKLTHQSAPMVRYELDMICQLLWRPNLEALIRREIGNKAVLERWINSGGILIRRQPRGLVLHNLSGNAFIVPVLSLIFGLLTKNVNLVKVASDEPLLGVRFAESLRELNPAIDRELAVLYWPGSDYETYDRVLASGAGAVIAWGSEESLNQVAAHTGRHRVKLVDHGPKLGFAVIDKPDTEQAARLAQGLALDIVPWEQYACLSPRLVMYIEGEVSGQDFAAMAADHLARVTQELPSATAECQRAATVIANREYYLSTVEAQQKGIVYQSSDTSWTVVYSSEPPCLDDLNCSLGRFIVIRKVDSLDDVLSFFRDNRLEPFCQVLGYNGDDEAFLEQVTRCGVSHVTWPGQMNIKPLGSSHDGVFNLAELTYVVSRQRTEADKYLVLPKDLRSFGRSRSGRK